MTAVVEVRRRRAAGLLAGVVAGAALLGGCGAGSTTCEEFGAQSDSDRQDTLQDLLADHDLVTSDPVNQRGVAEAVNSFCGVADGVTGATSNTGSTLDDAADWDAAYW